MIKLYTKGVQTPLPAIKSLWYQFCFAVIAVVVAAAVINVVAAVTPA